MPTASRPRFRLLPPATAALLSAALALPACQTSRLGDQPIEIRITDLSPEAVEPYETLASSSAFLDQRTVAAQSLLESDSRSAQEVLAWALEPQRPLEVNQAVLQAMFASPAIPADDLWWPLLRRIDSLPPSLTDDFALATSRFEGKPYPEQLTRIAEDASRSVVARVNAAASLGQRRTKASALTLLELTAADQPPPLRDASFAALGTLSGRDDLGADAAAWAAWWEQARSLNAADWERQLRENLVRREATDDITTDQLVDRLRELNITLYRLARPEDKPRVLTDLLGESLLPLRELGISLAEQRLASGGSFDEALRAALREVLVNEPAELRQRAATLLRDLSDEPAADRAAQRLAESKEHVTAVQGAYLLLLERLPRAISVDAAQGFLQDSALQSQAAAALASAARAGQLTGGQKRAVLRDVRGLLEARGGNPTAALVTLTGQVGQDREFEQIVGWLDHPEPAIRRAAAQAWADSQFPLVFLAERADDPVIQPIAITAARQRGQNPQTLRTLALFPPAPGTAARDAWVEALIAMAGRVAGDQALAAARALPADSLYGPREAVLTAALDAAPLDEQPSAAYLAMLLDRAEIRLATQRPKLAVLDFEGLVPRRDRLTVEQRERLDRGLVTALLQDDQLVKAFAVARRLYEGANGQLVQPSPDDPVIDLFVGAAESHVQAGRDAQGRRLLEELRMLLGPSMKPELAARIGSVEAQAQPSEPVDPAPPTAPDTAPSGRSASDPSTAPSANASSDR
ncbi:MAG: hypothetical protein AAGE65_11230 [Planctomycetota bacterium]